MGRPCWVPLLLAWSNAAVTCHALAQDNAKDAHHAEEIATRQPLKVAALAQTTRQEQSPVRRLVVEDTGHVASSAQVAKGEQNPFVQPQPYQPYAPGVAPQPQVIQPSQAQPTQPYAQPVAAEPAAAQPANIDPSTGQPVVPATAEGQYNLTNASQTASEEEGDDTFGAMISMLFMILLFGGLGYGCWYLYQTHRNSFRQQLQQLTGGSVRTMQNPQRHDHSHSASEARGADSGSHVERGESSKPQKQPLESRDTYRRTVLQANRNNQSESDNSDDNPPVRTPSKSSRSASKQTPTAGGEVTGQSRASSRASRYRVGQQS